MYTPAGPGRRFWRTRQLRSWRCCDRRLTSASVSSVTLTAGWCRRGNRNWPGTTRNTTQLRASIREACDYPFANGQRAGPIAFRDAVECLLDNPVAFDDHWSRQVDLLVADVIDYHIVGRFERFGQDFPAILRRLRAPAAVIDVASQVYNPTRPMALAAVYDPALARRVYGHYLADFETFGYHQDSWRLE